MVNIDTDSIKRGTGMSGVRFSDSHPDMESAIRDIFDSSRQYEHHLAKRRSDGASLSSVILALEVMDQGFDAVVAGLEAPHVMAADEWEIQTSQLVSPHKMFRVLLVADDHIRKQRLKMRRGWCSDDCCSLNPPSNADFTVNTSNMSVAATVAAITEAALDA